MCSDLSAALAAAPSLSIILRGVPAGAIRPNQTLTSKSGSPAASAIVGRFGAMYGRLASRVVLASPFGEAILIDRMQERDDRFWLPLQKILAEGIDFNR